MSNWELLQSLLEFVWKNSGDILTALVICLFLLLIFRPLYWLLSAALAPMRWVFSLLNWLFHCNHKRSDDTQIRYDEVVDPNGRISEKRWREERIEIVLRDISIKIAALPDPQILVGVLVKGEQIEEISEKRTGNLVLRFDGDVTRLFHFDFSRPLRFLMKDENRLAVIAPLYGVSTPPAIDTRTMQITVQPRSWLASILRRDGQKRLAEFTQDITPRLQARATNQETLELMREECRKNLVKFFQQLLRQSDKRAEIEVVFQDEPERIRQLESQPHQSRQLPGL